MKKKTLARVIESVSALLAGTYLFASFPGIRKLKKCQPLMHWNYAHRGLHDKKHGIPENSLTAFRRAVQYGYGMELDVRITKDDRLVIMHDPNTKRMCGLDQKVCDMTLEELHELRLSGTDEKIPLFSEVLETVGGHVPLIIEIKDETKNTYPHLCSLVWNELKNYQGIYCIESFHPGVVRWFKQHHPEVIRGQLSCRPQKNDAVSYFQFLLVTHLLSNCLTRPDFIAYCYKDIRIPAFLLNRHLFRPMIVLWTIPSRKEYERFRKKADLLIFENFMP